MFNNFAKQNFKDSIESMRGIVPIIGFTTLAITVFSTFSYLITYSFLFGYYFSGEVGVSYSNFELFRYSIPFQFNSLTTTYIMISISVALILSVQGILREKGMKNKLFTLLCIITYHLMMASFFMKELSFLKILQFSIIWVFPLYIALIVLFFSRGMESSFKAISGGLLCIPIIVLLEIFIKMEINQDWLVVIFSMSFFALGSLLSKVSNSKNWSYVYIFPYIFIIVGVIVNQFNYFTENTSNLKIAIVFGLTFLISLILSFFLRDTYLKNNSATNSTMNDSSVIKDICAFSVTLINPAKRKIGLAFLTITLLIVYVFTPKVSITVAKAIRTFNPDNASYFDIIKIKDFDREDKELNEEGKEFKGLIVAEKDDVIFITNEKWELVQIKAKEYWVEKAE